MKLYGLGADARYTVTDLDEAMQPVVATGASLTASGLAIRAPDRPRALVFTYQRR